ncbi:peptidoglycan DD-metalloendopeptidase family protein [Peribacillus simplex]|uniref:M23 family metallopeptidase n=1 Tax=Bacillaceae TaxID=186817 RepID=UPI0006608E16|nr:MULTISPECIES: M23 family metallopeptidase [Bacillaceae]MCP1092784.1 peptidoglycan DD-metalloendopeptidase family protein [Bacillaceae bacterium OS4b]MBD8587106.1 peptidoglycan DD-metalloendopeptidase family protein [Peribacillus simplex]MCF7625209.1 peptidoglycan DD-metalloendopeptidase family protein [Peribacillus frigoritolerans]MEA3574695.1 peptidoglycan DD-metalloendopeptidase family protein [Peribacillus frigoritolerans]PRA92571.1 peptidase M23 [Peribacillus simplex]
MREEEKKPTSTIRRILKQRWALSAIYIASAAIILAAAFLLQNSFDDSAKDGKEESAETGKNYGEPSVEVNSNLETIKMPVADADKSVIKKQFYDVNADEKAQEEALVFYNNRYEQNKGIDIAMEDGKSFDVKASLSGNVTKVQDDALLGNLVEVEHEDGVVTRYQSVKDIKVAVGDKVKQGQAIATAGKSQINEEAGVHVHFEIRKDNIALNPLDFVDKQASAIQSATDAEADKEETPAVEGSEADKEETPAVEGSEADKETPAVEGSEADKEETPAVDETDESTDLESGTDEEGSVPGEDTTEESDSLKDSLNQSN